MNRYLLLLFSFFSFFQSIGQSDSLWHVFLDETQSDSTRALALNKYVWADYLFVKPDSAYLLIDIGLETLGSEKVSALLMTTKGISCAVRGQLDEAEALYYESIAIQEKYGDFKGVAGNYNNLGILYDSKGEPEKSIDFLEKSIEYQSKAGDWASVAKGLTNLGNTHNKYGDLNKSLEYQEQALKLNLWLGNDVEISRSYNNLGTTNKLMGLDNVAIDWFMKSYAISERLDDKLAMIQSKNNIAGIYISSKQYDVAIGHLRESIQMGIETQNVQSLVAAYIQMGSVYRSMEQYDSAKFYMQKGFDLAFETGAKLSYIDAAVDLGYLYFKLGDKDSGNYFFEFAVLKSKEAKYTKGVISTLVRYAKLEGENKEWRKVIAHAEEAKKLAEEFNFLAEKQKSSEYLWYAYEQTKNFELALYNYKDYISLRDSLKKDQLSSELVRQETTFEFEKQAYQDSVANAETLKTKDAEVAAEKARGAHQKTISIALVGGLVIVALFGFFAYNRFKIARQQRDVIESAHHELAEKNQEILDSIAYAKRIQSAILPPDKNFKAVLPHSFILYQPKDIVAGDFYWLEQKNDTLLFAAADCTGHGVPGAMVSVVCNNGLNRSVREYGLVEPGLILDKTREIVIQEFEKSEEDVKDGMDIALVALEKDPSSTSGAFSLKFAGAHNPLWIIRKGATEIEEIKADKQPIGKFVMAKPFNTTTVNLNEGDVFYLFSDGFADQFGGDKGKKFKAANFKKLLLSIQSQEMEAQKKTLHETFEAWRGSLEQLDDLCVIGIKI